MNDPYDLSQVAKIRAEYGLKTSVELKLKLLEERVKRLEQLVGRG